jgi:hypothetical protein
MMPSPRKPYLNSFHELNKPKIPSWGSTEKNFNWSLAISDIPKLKAMVKQDNKPKYTVKGHFLFFIIGFECTMYTA